MPSSNQHASRQAGSIKPVEVKWGNVAVFGMVLAALVVVLCCGDDVKGVLGSLFDFRTGGGTEARIHSVVVIGMFLATLVAIIRMLIDAERKH